MAETNYQANEGSPTQFPRGAAAELNENTNVQAPSAVEAPAPADTTPAEAPDESLEAASPADFIPEGYVPLDEDEAFITGPTLRPEESQSVGAQFPSPLSNRVRAALPTLQAAASEPGASPELVGLVKLLLRDVGR